MRGRDTVGMGGSGTAGDGGAATLGPVRGESADGASVTVSGAATGGGGEKRAMDRPEAGPV